MAAPRLVFICGLHRSGTTLLQRMLSTHPDISGFFGTGVREDEGQLLQTVYPAARVFGGPGKFAFAPDAHLTEHSKLITQENRETLLAQWSPHWDTTKPWLLEKSPPNIIRSTFLQAMFPGSYFIFLVRHPIAVSFATQKWSHTDIAQLMDHWQEAHRIMLLDQPRLRHRLTLRYEDLVDQPARTLSAICDFLKIPDMRPDAQLQDHFNAGYFADWESYRNTQISDYAQAITNVSLAEHFGYRLSEPYVIDATSLR